MPVASKLDVQWTSTLHPAGVHKCNHCFHVPALAWAKVNCSDNCDQKRWSYRQRASRPPEGSTSHRLAFVESCKVPPTSFAGGGLQIRSPSRRCRRDKSGAGVVTAAAGSWQSQTYYEVLGVDKTADDREIKRAYRKAALKYHPDVNKEADAEARFVRIKLAYQTLSDSKSRLRYDSELRGGWGFGGSQAGGTGGWDPSDPFGTKRGKKTTKEEDFYGLENFFSDIAKDLESWSKERQDKPKSLWEELADIGEEFVEFLEMELGIPGEDSGGGKPQTKPANKKESSSNGTPKDSSQTAGSRASNNESDVDAMLAKLKKELGL